MKLLLMEKGFINKDQLLNIAQKFSKSDYGQYIKNVYLGLDG